MSATGQASRSATPNIGIGRSTFRSRAGMVTRSPTRTPPYQIAFYMQHAGTEWGILTNGRLWRLYHKDTAHKLDRFYEVDLPALVNPANAEAFLYFYAFFHGRVRG